MEEEMQGILVKSVRHNKLWGAVKTLGDLAAIQKSLHGLEERANNDLVKLARTNNLALSLVWTNFCHQYLLGNCWLGSSSAETDLKVMVDSNLSVTWQDALAASSILGCISGTTAGRSKERFIHFYSVLIRLCLDCPAPVWVTPQYRKVIDNLGQIHQRASRLISGRTTCSVRRGWEIGLVQPGKEMAWGHLATTFSCLWGSYREDWDKLFHWGVWLEVDSLGGDILTWLKCQKSSL